MTATFAMAFLEPARLWLLLLVPALWLLFWWAARRRRASLEAMAGPRAARSTSGARSSRRWREGWLLLGIMLLALAAARPWWKKEPVDASAGSRDVLFMLDVSRSMLAADLSPNRLENARLAIYDCLERLDGNRVALVTFAGSSSIECPFTTDYTFFRERLAAASPDNVAQGGTRIGDALQKSIDKILEEKRRGQQDIILLSDGGDQESRPSEIAASLGDLEVHFVVVGLGDSTEGARIPARAQSELEIGLARPSRFTMHQGREVWSKLESANLDILAKSCPLGVYLAAGTRPLDLGSVYLDLARHFESTQMGANENLLREKDEFPGFLLAALVALGLARTTSPVSRATSFRRPLAALASRSSAAALFLVLGLALFSLAASPEDPSHELAEEMEEQANPIPKNPREAFRVGAERFEEGSYASAADCFRAALHGLGTDPLREAAAGNLGIALFQQAEQVRIKEPALAAEIFLRSAAAFRSRLDWDPSNSSAAIHLELARTRCRECEEEVRRAEESQEKQEQEEQGEESEEGDPSEEGEERDDEGEYEEGESEGEADSTNQSSSQTAMDMDSRDIPPPAIDPEDIFQEQAENAEAREKKGPGKYKAVERDW